THSEINDIVQGVLIPKDAMGQDVDSTFDWTNAATYWDTTVNDKNDLVKGINAAAEDSRMISLPAPRTPAPAGGPIAGVPVPMLPKRHELLNTRELEATLREVDPNLKVVTADMLFKAHQRDVELAAARMEEEFIKNNPTTLLPEEANSWAHYVYLRKHLYGAPQEPKPGTAT
ncbi:unnamed protein product, partial [marine sediment metagenome]